MDSTPVNPVTPVSVQLRRLLLYYGSPKAAEKTTGIPRKYFYPVKSTRSIRNHIAGQYKKQLTRAGAEIDGVFEIRLSWESLANATAVAQKKNTSVRELAESFLEEHFRA